MRDIPIYKVGLVLLRDVASTPRVLWVRPNPKNPGDATPLVLPRGSRQYKAADGTLRDVRDDAVAQAHRYQLEPLYDTLVREAEEEAGVPPSLLAAADIIELGARMYRSSPASPPRHIHWYARALKEHEVGALNPTPADALTPPVWLTLNEAHTLATKGEARGGYMAVIEEALMLVTG